MPLSAGQGFVDLLPRVNAAAFTAAANAQLKGPAANAATATAKTFGQKFSAGFKSALLPIAAVAVGAASLAVARLTIEFENAFTRIAAISNATEEQITRWRDAVFELGQETAIAPQKLADGLFFLASAGLDANQIFPALEASAKGAAIGLGEMEDITRTVAQVLNAYPEAGLQAVDVIDTLTAAVRESTAEPEEFATALGRVLPIASKAGVEIDNVVASLATLSNIGLDVDEGVTGIRQVLNLIVSPGKQATETMNELGISTEKLRDRLADKGIINTLRFLNDRVGESEDKFRKLLPNIRAMTAAFGLTEQEASKVDGIFRRVANSSGDLSEALEETQAGPGFKFRRLMISLQEAAIKLGQVFLPIGTTIAEAFTTILGPAVDLLAILGQYPDVITAVFLAFASLKIIGLLGSLFAKLTTFIVGSTVALAATSTATQTLALTSAEAAAAQTFLAATAGRSAATLVVDTTATVADTVATNGLTAAKTRLAVAMAAINPLVVAAALGIGLIAFGMKDAANQAAKLERATEGLARRLVSGDLNEEGIREIFGKQNEEIPEVFRDQAEAFKRGIFHRANAITDAQREANREIAAENEKVAAIVFPVFTQQAEILTSMGTNITKFSDAAVRALHRGDEAFDKFSKGAIEEAAKILEDFHDDAVENLNFTVGALQDLSSEASSAAQELEDADLSVMSDEDVANLREAADLTARELLDSFKEARRETQDFGRDLLEISRNGGEAGDRVAEVLLGMGDAGVAAAETIADAGPKMQEALVSNFALGEGAAESLATKLTRRIVGTLKSIEEILSAIARAFDIDVALEGGGPVIRDLETIRDRMNEVDGTTATVHVTTVFRREGGELPEGFVPPGQDPGNAAGGIVGAARGGVTRRPTLLVGEGRGHTPYGKGAEAILPLDEHTVGRLGNSIARQIEMPTIIVKVGEEELARTVTRGQRRRRALVGA